MVDVLYDEEFDAHLEMLKEKAREFLASIGKDSLEIYRIEKFNPVR
jgi:hypothetical protein